jgi:hypothetical protein
VPALSDYVRDPGPDLRLIHKIANRWDPGRTETICGRRFDDVREIEHYPTCVWCVVGSRTHR